eukprot:CAMPEP_0113433698 /NCGR_PEP_ID=MMETSP0013_2-20120614/35079_1 /TAXON_ID=2843 ORGANISM="Skeletonema costatum, Strain 1716" /NCGR_SAMPLE_ID=MMETSP0013_2 /ASSEMBLY_ACC=CAM_ASM_000158 /LENGTH=676 /DNA_ID=CAMNT_0000323419 /DNA_START=70 /DNA_END=2097 /DNA_ORIENTATION=+ /assembly_acc=CAM_ASM_000158
MSTEERTYCFVDSLERQSALIVAINTAVENGDIIGLDGWKYIWGMIFELRDLQLLSGKNLKESDPDLLTGEARIEFSRRLMQLDEPDVIHDTPRKGIMSLVFGTGSSENLSNQLTRRGSQQSLHGKEDLLLWDEIASSDEEDEPSSNNEEYASLPYYQRSPSRQFSSVGTAFENQLFNEMAYGNDDLPVTGLERIDSRQAELLSPRGRVRNRLANLVDFNGLISETRYLCDDGLSDTLNALIDIIRDSSKNNNANEEAAISGLPISPASEAFAEILLCEVVRKNRDRFAFIWENILSAHYNSRLTCRPEGSEVESDSMILTPGIEKCVSGILKICIWASSRNVFANEVLPTLEILHPPLGACVWSPLELNLDKHLSEGLWRICRNVDGLSQIDDKAWEGILGLLDWCASRGGIPSRDNFGSLDEDDPSLQAFRSLHLMLHAEELKDIVPYGVVKSIRSLVEAGERGHCPKLSIAGLDLLQLIHTRMETLVIQKESELLLHCWNPTIDAVAEPAEKSRNGNVRQHALTLLTDMVLDRHGTCIPLLSLCEIMNSICIPIAGERITDLLRIPRNADVDLEEIMIELELCISLLFKPFLHHLKNLVSLEQEFLGIWISMLGIMTHLLGDDEAPMEEDDYDDGIMTREKLFRLTQELGSEHLRNAVMVLIAMNVLVNDDDE